MTFPFGMRILVKGYPSIRFNQSPEYLAGCVPDWEVIYLSAQGKRKLWSMALYREPKGDYS